MSIVTLAAVGDIMLGDHPVCFGHGIRSTMKKKGSLHFVKDVTKAINGHDLIFGNLECVISDIGHDENDLASSELRGAKASVELLKLCGFNLLSIANNHMLQHGVAAFNDTVSELKNNGIECVGRSIESVSNVVTVTKNDLHVSIIGYSLRAEQYSKQNNSYAQAGYEQIIKQIGELKKLYSNHSIIVSLHWGDEYLHAPSRLQINFAHKMVDSGATLILGHHPHVLQGIEEYKSGVIAYSLGNFMFDSWQKSTRESAIIKCTFDKQGLSGLKVEPIYIRPDFSITSKSLKHNKTITSNIDMYSNTITDNYGLSSLDSNSYADVAAKAYFRYRLNCYLYFVINLWRYKPSIILHSLRRAILRRVGFK